MVPFEIALVNFYRPSIVTFPLYLCVSDSGKSGPALAGTENRLVV